MIRTLVALVLAGLLAGCGGNNGFINKSTSTTTTTPPTTSPAVLRAIYKFPPTMSNSPSATDTSNAQSVGLTIKDFPSTWKIAEPRASTTPRPEIEDEVFVNCLFGENPSPLSGYAVSDFYVPSDLSVQYRSFVRATTSQANAVNDFKNFSAARIASCQDGMYDYEQLPPDNVEQVYGKKFGSAVPIEMPVDPLTLADPTSTKNVLGFRMIITPTDAPAVHQDIFAYGSGRYEVVMIVQARIVPDVTEETTIFDKMKSRTISAAKLG
jgi:hypothetical protein